MESGRESEPRGDAATAESAISAISASSEHAISPSPASAISEPASSVISARSARVLTAGVVVYSLMVASPGLGGQLRPPCPMLVVVVAVA
jgi:hypothetical protein